MHPLTVDQIREIAEEIDSGMSCFWNPEEAELIFIPNPENFFNEEAEGFEELQEKIDSNPDAYHELKPLSSFDTFQIMESYADTLPDKMKLKERLFNALSKKHPFREFNWEIDNSGEYRQAWFAYKAEYMQNYVRRWADFLLSPPLDRED